MNLEKSVRNFLFYVRISWSSVACKAWVIIYSHFLHLFGFHPFMINWINFLYVRHIHKGIGVGIIGLMPWVSTLGLLALFDLMPQLIITSCFSHPMGRCIVLFRVFWKREYVIEFQTCKGIRDHNLSAFLLFESPNFFFPNVTECLWVAVIAEAILIAKGWMSYNLWFQLGRCIYTQLLN